MIKFLIFIAMSSHLYSQTTTFANKHHRYLETKELTIFLMNKFPEVKEVPYECRNLKTGGFDLKSGKRTVKKPNDLYISEYLNCLEDLIEESLNLLVYPEKSTSQGDFIEVSFLQFGESFTFSFLEKNFSEQVVLSIFTKTLSYENSITLSRSDSLIYDIIRSDSSLLEKSSIIELIKHLHKKFVGPETVLEQLGYFGESSVYTSEELNIESYFNFFYEDLLKGNSQERTQLSSLYSKIIKIIFMNENLIKE